MAKIYPTHTRKHEMEYTFTVYIYVTSDGINV